MIELLAAEGIDPTPVTAWLLLIVALFSVIAGTVGGIAALFKWFVIPHIVRLIETRLDVAEQAFSASIRRLHERIDKHITEQH